MFRYHVYCEAAGEDPYYIELNKQIELWRDT